MFSSSSYHPLLILAETQSVSCISLNFLTLISGNFRILLGVWWLWNLRIPPKWQAGNKNVSACETPPWLAASLYHHSRQGCTLLSFSTWVCMCSGSSWLTECCVAKNVLQPLQRHLTVCRFWLLWSLVRCCSKCSCMPKIREQFCHQQR